MEIQNYSYLVTGGAGFIGSHLVDALLHQGAQKVRILDNFSTGSWENIQHNLSALEIIEGDLTDLQIVRDAMNGIDYVFHLAAIPSVTRSIVDPIATNNTNINGTLNVLIAAREHNVNRVVYSSSSSIYGDSPLLPIHENLPANPLSPYAVSKLAGERYCLAFTRVYGLPTVCLRYFNVFGPRQNAESEYAAVIPKFITKMLNDEEPVIYGDGLQSRDFTFVSNVVAANILACFSDAVIGQVLNVATGNRFSLLDLVGKLNKLLGKNISPQFKDARLGDVKHSQADVTKLTTLLNFRPIVSFEDGLCKTVEWFLKLKNKQHSN